MTEATRRVVQLTAAAVTQYNNHLANGSEWARQTDQRSLDTCMAACKAQGLQPKLIRDIDGSVAVMFEEAKA